MCSISPFGLTGPHKDYKAHDLTLSHAGGWAWLSPGALDRADLPPLKAFGQQCDFQGGLAAATATLGAYYRALGTGAGEHTGEGATKTTRSPSNEGAAPVQGYGIAHGLTRSAEPAAVPAQASRTAQGR